MDKSMDEGAIAALQNAAPGELKIITAMPNPDCEHGDNGRTDFYITHDVESIEVRDDGTVKATSVPYSTAEKEECRDWTIGRPVAVLKRLREVAEEQAEDARKTEQAAWQVERDAEQQADGTY